MRPGAQPQGESPAGSTTRSRHPQGVPTPTTHHPSGATNRSSDVSDGSNGSPAVNRWLAYPSPWDRWQGTRCDGSPFDDFGHRYSTSHVCCQVRDEVRSTEAAARSTLSARQWPMRPTNEGREVVRSRAPTQPIGVDEEREEVCSAPDGGASTVRRVSLAEQVEAETALRFDDVVLRVHGKP